jgi:hypothetical protein
LSYLYYAAYGSNLHPVRLAARVPSAELVGTAFQPGWSLRFNKLSNVDGSAKCSIERGGTGTHHAIYGLLADEKFLLDACEGLGNGYDELVLDVPEFGRCFTYVASASHVRSDLEPFDWYQAMVLRGAEFNRFPGDYIDTIRSVDALPDPDEARKCAQWEIVARLHSAI